jgi:gas vesicle protein
MSDDPDVIRADIEETRRELSGNVDALADKVTPSKIAHRQTEKMKSAVRTVTDRVMGAADSGTAAAGSVGDTVTDAGRAVVDKAQGNPLAVGLIAFGVGWLAASLIPASDKEREIAANVKDAAQPLIHEAASAAKQVADDLREPAKEAVDAVKVSATDAVGAVKDEATDAAHDVADDASQAKHAVENNGA